MVQNIFKCNGNALVHFFLICTCISAIVNLEGIPTLLAQRRQPRAWGAGEESTPQLRAHQAAPPAWIAAQESTLPPQA
jgi:hypothetical protein